MIILTSKKFTPTANLLGELLGITPKTRIQQDKIPPSELLIRWGNLIRLKEPDKTINPLEGIILSNKRNFSNFLKEEGFPTITLQYVDSPQIEVPVIIRKDLYSFKGKGILFINTREKLREIQFPCWISNFIPVEREYRVLWGIDEVLKIFEKVPKEPGECIVKNSESCNYRRKNLKYYRKLVEFCEKIMEKIPYKMIGGFDIGDVGGEYIVFEFNTAPGLNLNSAQLVADKIKSLIGEENV